MLSNGHTTRGFDGVCRRIRPVPGSRGLAYVRLERGLWALTAMKIDQVFTGKRKDDIACRCYPDRHAPTRRRLLG
ncbi:hypothetical protein BRAS3809_4550001 [Bradyrhizobium sp. STM 3809]|nr:hypothetical protein BRAS3809_4550001 [Bradyrhizobium sp. STM 3809]